MKDHPKISVHFLGAAGTVTGSKYLIDTGNHKILVDCGLFQGLKKLRLMNWEGLPVNVQDIDLILLTHGHLDHTGFLPRLVRLGYGNDIVGTAPTLDVASVILRDSAKIQEEGARKANKDQFSKHHPAKPLYTVKDAERSIALFRPAPEGERIELFPDIYVRFVYVGHIIGATYLELDIYGKRFVLSGDVGRPEDHLLRAPQKPGKADVLFIESTYGDRLHPTDNVKEELARIVKLTAERGGTLIIPSFAVERAQTLMYLLWQLKSSEQIPDIPMVLDSPMGDNVLDIFSRYREWHKLSPDDYTRMCESFWIVESIRETQLIIASERPKIIIAGSGMISGGRVLNYLEHYLSDPKTSVLLAGFQAEGTRGRALLNGAQTLKIYGKYHTVKAEVFNLDELSSHADQSELLDWLNKIENTPKHIFIVHGEPHAADTFRVRLRDTYGWKARIPELYEIVEIS